MSNKLGGKMHRKSAVELLQESKASYVKSEDVLDRKQELNHSRHFQVTSSSMSLHSPTLMLRKSTSSEIWLRDSQKNDSNPQLQDMFPMARTRFYSSARKSNEKRPNPMPGISTHMDDDQLLAEQLARSIGHEQSNRKCTCHVVFKKASPNRYPSLPRLRPAKHNSKSPKRNSEVAKCSNDGASRDQFQTKLRRLLRDEESQETTFGASNGQQHKSMPDLRASHHGTHNRLTTPSPGPSLRSDYGIEDQSLSPAFAVPEISWRFFDDEPLCLRAPEGFRDKDPEDASMSDHDGETPSYQPPDAATCAMLDRFFRQMGLEDENFSSSSMSRESSPVFFDSIGSVDTPRSSNGTDPPRFSSLTSIVERNARIIKWLCNCRKAGLRTSCIPS